MNWVNSKQGKSKALNLGLFNSFGKYVIHIDSDGVLQRDAIRNMVVKFERNADIDCMTGTIMTNPEMIDETKGFGLRSENLSFLSMPRLFLPEETFSQNSTTYLHFPVLFQRSDVPPS